MRRIALVLNNNMKDGRSQFAEDVAKNRGLNLRTFFDRDEAIKWLRGE